MEEKILNIALDDMALKNSTSEENLDIMCPTSCCKTIKMLLLDIADGKKEMNEKLSYIKDLEEKLTKLEIKSSLFSEREQSLEGKVKDKNDVIAALKASIEIYQSIKLSDTKPNEALNEELRNIKDMLKKLTESTEVHGRQTKPEDLSLSNDIAQAVKNQKDYILELQTSVLDKNSQLRTKDLQITQQTTALKQKTEDIAKLKADWNTYKQRTDNELKANKSKMQSMQQLKQNEQTVANLTIKQLKSANAELTKSKAKIVELEELLKKTLEQLTSTKAGDESLLIKTLKANLAASENQLKQLNANHAKKISELSNSTESFEKILATNKALLKDRDNQIQQLKSNINGLHARLKQIKLDNSVHKQNHIKNQSQLTHLSNELANANALIDSRKMEIHKLKKLLENAGKNKNEYCEPSLAYEVLQIDGIKPFVATYDSNHEDSLVPSWIIIQRRIDGTVSFDRFWTDYSKGFGENKSEFWLGLEKLHALTLNKRHELYIYLVDFYNQVRYARYDNFAIASETEKYKLKSLGNYTGNSGDIMRKYEGKAFDIHDSCGGWWYNKKYETHLNGTYSNENSMEHEQGLHFGNWYFGSSIPIKYVRMLIRSY